MSHISKTLFTLVALACFLLLNSCNQDDPDDNSSGGGGGTPCSIDTALLTNIVWQPPIAAYATIEFNTNGIYYENGSNDGNWSLVNNCDSIYVTRPSNNFYMRIVQLTSNTLVLHTSVFGDVTFTH